MTIPSTAAHTPHALHVSTTARAGARRIARRLNTALNGLSPRSEVAAVVDTSYHLTQGYITCSTGRGPIRVLGAPYNTLVPGMRIFVRRFTNEGQTSYLYDGMITPAVAVSNGGSIAATTGTGPAAYPNATWTATTGGYSGPYVTLPAGAPAKGWFVSFFFYVSQLPRPGEYVTFLDLALLTVSPATITGGLRFLMDYQAHLGVEVYGSGWGDLTTQTKVWTAESYSPHALWWFNYTLGGVGYSVGSVQYTAGNSAINSLGSTMATGPVSSPVTIFLLSSSEQLSGQTLNPAPPATWISKVIVGANVSGTTPVSPTPIVVDPVDATAAQAAQDANIPTDNSQLITSSNVSYLLGRYLFDDSTPGGSTLVDTSGHAFDLTVYNGSLRSAGPY